MKQLFISIAVALIVAIPVSSQGNRQQRTNSNTEELIITDQISLPATSVKNQSSTGTCWCFATISMLESELLRMGKGEYNLSEMFVVRNNYIDRLKDNYIRQGKGNLGPGSFAHDVLRVIDNDGIVPEEAYDGLNYGSATHNHSELQSFIDAAAAVAVQRRSESEQYGEIVNAILDTYLGEYPDHFTYKGTDYTPKSFAADLGLDMDDYVEISSYTHWPFYEMGVLEVPDNWTMDKLYNVPIDEFMEIAEYSLKNGYTFAWDADVSEQGFSSATGLAQLTAASAVDAARRQTATTAPTGTVKVDEIEVDQKYRQQTYENFTTTDDHLMHITGMATDQFGNKYFKVKNSWGTDRSKFDGYLYATETYFRGKTLSILVNKNAIPPAIKTKLGIDK